MESENPITESSAVDAVDRLGTSVSGRELADVLFEAARRVLRSRFRIVLLIRNAYEHMTTHSSPLEAVWTDLKTALRLLIAWTRRSYRQVSAGALVILVASLVYFVTPLDVIPDTLGAIGFVDDVAVIGTAVETVREELDQFRAWESEGDTTT